MEALWLENVTLRLKALSLGENDHTRASKHNNTKANNNKVEEKRINNELHNLVNKYEEIAKQVDDFIDR